MANILYVSGPRWGRDFIIDSMCNKYQDPAGVGFVADTKQGDEYIIIKTLREVDPSGVVYSQHLKSLG